MAAEWGLGMGMGMGMTAAPSAAVAPPNSSTYLYGLPSTDTLRIDDLLDFSNHNVFSSSTGSTASGAAYNYNHLPQPDHNSSLFTITTGEGGNIDSGSHHLCSFPDDLYAPSDEAAELEWLSKFVEDSFSDVPYPLSTMITTNNHSSGNKSNSNNYHLTVNNNQIQVDPTSAAPRQGARSKRSIASSFIANMTSTLRHHQRNSSSSSSTSSSSSSDFPHTNNTTTTPTSSGSSRRKGHMNDGTNIGVGVEGGVRRCTHCASEKTPQWRTGPLGPKTLCNACGVRYKSGRLVPEYRPAASPTFVLTQHSNSHRKVMELRRQKEQVHLIRHDNVSSASTATEMIYHDYEQ